MLAMVPPSPGRPLSGLSQSLAQALAPHNIFVGVVAPGFVHTDMAAALLDGLEGEGIPKQSPLGRVVEAEEIAQAVVRLTADVMMYATGCILTSMARRICAVSR